MGVIKQSVFEDIYVNMPISIYLSSSALIYLAIH